MKFYLLKKSAKYLRGFFVATLYVEYTSLEL